MLGLHRTVIALGVVSFFTDLSSEMIFPLLPIFLAQVLVAGPKSLGIIEGFAEATASLFKVISGVFSDKFNNRKPFVLAGYSVSGLVRPLIALATVWPVVLFIRVIDRLGKGLRTSPRDALIAQTTPAGKRGRAFGFHRAMDHAGAVAGPIVASILMALFHFSLREVFAFAIIPSLFVVVIIVLFVKEDGTLTSKEEFHSAKDPETKYLIKKNLPYKNLESTKTPSKQSLIKAEKRQFTDSLRHFWNFNPSYNQLVLSIFIFTLGGSTDAFFLLYLVKIGISNELIPLLWSAHHVVKMISSYFGGRLSDIFGHKRMLSFGWAFYVIIYASFSLAGEPIVLASLFLLYGIYYGFVEASQKAMVANSVHSHQRGKAFGLIQFVEGMALLPASILFGFLWESFGAPVAFYVGACAAVMGLSILSLRIHSR